MLGISYWQNLYLKVKGLSLSMKLKFCLCFLVVLFAYKLALIDDTQPLILLLLSVPSAQSWTNKNAQTEMLNYSHVLFCFVFFLILYIAWIFYFYLSLCLLFRYSNSSLLKSGSQSGGCTLGFSFSNPTILTSSSSSVDGGDPPNE